MVTGECTSDDIREKVLLVFIMLLW